MGFFLCMELEILKGGLRGSAILTIQEYINWYYALDAQKVSFHVLTKNILDLSLKIIILITA